MSTVTTIIRVKRRYEDDPVDNFILSFKKRKAEDDANGVNECAVLHLTGTVEAKNDEETLNVFKHKANSYNFKLRPSDFTTRHRTEEQQRIKENRFKVLSLNRSVLDPPDDKNESKEIAIVDVAPQIHDGDQCLPNPKYVYDLYAHDYFVEDDFQDIYMENLFSLQPMALDMQYRGSEDSEEIDPYDEDSNEETNWKNDYPDSDNSINEEDMRLAAGLHGMGIDNGIDLSSDEEDERYLGYSGGISPEPFEKYKSRVMNDLVETIDSSNDEHDSRSDSNSD